MSGAAVCWGWDEYGQSSPPEGTFTAIAAGAWHTCSPDISCGGNCWGACHLAQIIPPTGTFIAIAAGAYSTTLLH